jgi:hypothetical protein
MFGTRPQRIWRHQESRMFCLVHPGGPQRSDGRLISDRRGQLTSAGPRAASESPDRQRSQPFACGSEWIRRTVAGRATQTSGHSVHARPVPGVPDGSRRPGSGIRLRSAASWLTFTAALSAGSR